MQVVVFDTKAEYDAIDADVLAAHLADHTEEPYHTQTVKWAEARERLDGKWDAPCCEQFDYSAYAVEEYNSDNYPATEYM